MHLSLLTDTLGITLNEISGTLPSEIANWSNSLRHLLLNSNMLTGTLPSEIGLLQNLGK